MSKSKSKIEDKVVPVPIPKPWTQDEEIMLYSMREDGLPYRIISSELLCRSVNSCEKKYRSTIWVNKPFYDNAKHTIKEGLKKAYVERLANLTDKRISVNQVKADIIGDRLVRAIEALPNVPKPRKSKRKKFKKDHVEDVGLIISDCHIGEEFTLEETGGLGEYNLNIFKQRVDNLTYAATDIVDLHSRIYTLKTLHLFCLGDIVAGMNDVGAWSPIYINMPIFEQFVEGVEALAQMIDHWLTIFEDINFYGVFGNHGRVSKRGSEKEYVNWDFMTYQFLMCRFKNNPRVKFNVPKTWWIFEKIRSHKFLIVHGDDMKGMAWPAKSLLDFEQKMIGILKDIPDYTIAGHYHSAAELSTNHGKVLLNGSFIGGDIYSLKNLQRSSLPEQKIFGIHDRRGITWTYDLNLNIERR